ncbi:protein kinase domain-containing protein [[Phormidium ambiguum] IAM M-71]|nr:serine/threonine-protein kinase [Phormidium ambiguum]
MADTMIEPGLLLQNRYQVIRLLGGGGFGKIFEINDGQVPKVLKVLNPQHFKQPEVKRKAQILFQREAEILSKLQHPGIPHVALEGYFTWPEGGSEPLHCLVMEKIPGSNLQEWLSGKGNQPITTAEAYQWLIQLIEILSLLHQYHYFHRDIKPSNIMLKPDGQLVLIDFGAVREVTRTYLQQQQENVTGTVIISAGYTPPEQAEGRAVLQSDFFALGRTFVYLLTGQSLINLPRNPETGELIWREQAVQVSPEIADLIDWLMAPFPGQRPQSCQEILQRLAKFKPGSSKTKVDLLRDKFLKISEKVNVKHTSLLGLFAIISLLIGSTSWGLFSPKLANYFNDRGLALSRNGNFEIAMFYYQLALIFDAKIAQTYHNMGLIYEDTGQLDKARSVYKNAIRYGLSASYSNLARLYNLNQEYTTAVELLQKGLPLAKNEDVKYAMLKNMGLAKLKLGRYQEALNYLQTAIQLESDRAPAYCLKAQVMERQNNKQAAFLAWRNCLKYANTKNPDEKMWISMAPSTLKTEKR